MGADLITYILVVPKDIQEDKARSFARDLRGELAVILEGLKRGEDLDDLTEGRDKAGKALYNVFDGLTIDTESVEALMLDLGDENLDRVLDFLKTTYPRDTNSRPVKIGGEEFNIIVSGDTTWGDTPEGEGYSFCAFILATGLDEALGIQ